jgi:hypothetical protein
MPAKAILSAQELIDRFRLASSDLVIEVGSASGSFLATLQHNRLRVLGIETERRAVVEAFCRGIDTVWGEFTSSLASGIRTRYGPARLIIFRSEITSQTLAAAHMCLAHDGIVLNGQTMTRMIELQRAA